MQTNPPRVGRGGPPIGNRPTYTGLHLRPLNTPSRIQVVFFLSLTQTLSPTRKPVILLLTFHHPTERTLDSVSALRKMGCFILGATHREDSWLVSQLYERWVPCSKCSFEYYRYRNLFYHVSFTIHVKASEHLLES